MLILPILFSVLLPVAVTAIATVDVPSWTLWHFNRPNCVLAESAPKVSQRIKLLKLCEQNESIKTSIAKIRRPLYLGWKNIPIKEVWDITTEGTLGESESTKLMEKIKHLPEVTGTFTEFLYKNLEVDDENRINVAVSPLSMEIMLAALGCGAASDTRQEIFRVLGVNNDNVAIKYKTIIDQLELKKRPYLQIVTKFYLEQAFHPVKEEYSSILFAIFNIQVEKANFHVGSGTEIERINAFVAEKTEGHIKDAVEKETVNEHTEMLLVNTLYFKGEWENQFQKIFGFNDNFHLPKEKTLKATYMSREEIYYHYKEAKGEKYRMLELPFLSQTADPEIFSMIIILPDDVDGLPEVEKILTKDDSWLKNFDLVSSSDTAVVKPTIPRFTVDSRLNLKSALNKMGVLLMFEDSSDFRGISDNKIIKTAKIHQRIYIDVNEKGIRAPSSTKSTPGTRREVGKPVKEFFANHPFAFALIQRVTKTVLFIGRVLKPGYDDLFTKMEDTQE